MTLVNSVPASFSVTGDNGDVTANLQTVSFAIPSGTYSQAYWQVDGTIDNWFAHGTEEFFVFDTTNTAPGTWEFSKGSNSSLETAYQNVVGDLQSPGFPLPATLGGHLSLAAVNAAAGTTLTCYFGWYVFGFTASITRLTLYLVPASTGGSPTSFTVTQQGTGKGGCDTFVIELMDSSGNAANAGGSGQVFTYGPLGNSQMAGGTLTIGSSSSSGTFTVCSKESGSFQIQVCPGTGALSEVACQTITATFTGAPTDPNAAMCAITRPNIRDAVRMNLGIATPLSTGTGFAGDEPPGQRYPTNFELNQAIADALRFINSECNLHMQADLPIAVVAPAVTAVGPLIIPLAGIQGCPSNLSVNTIRRCRFVDTAGNITRLEPTSYWEIDKNRWSFDTVPAANPPRWYMIDGYKLFILPQPSVAGTLYLYAGTAMQNFWGDSDTIDELPSDHQLTLEWLATAFTCLKKPDEPNNMVQFEKYMALAEPGVRNIKKFFQMMNEAYEPSVSADVSRRRRVR